MNELWSRSHAKIYDGKLEDFKRLAEDLLSAIREHDCGLGLWPHGRDRRPTRASLTFQSKGQTKMKLPHSKHSDDAFDHVIVGAGAAGSVLANRLSEDPNNRVLLLEYGGRETERHRIFNRRRRRTNRRAVRLRRRRAPPFEISHGLSPLD